MRIIVLVITLPWRYLECCLRYFSISEERLRFLKALYYVVLTIGSVVGTLGVIWKWLGGSNE